jgi:CRP/FNR family transcriptional regulator
MPSAQQKETGGSTVTTNDGKPYDLHSLLHAIRPSNVSYLKSFHRRGQVLFTEGEPARGVYILRTGRAAVSISSRDGRNVIVRLTQTGDVLGLNSVLQNSHHDTTVKTLEPCSTEFIARSELMEMIGQSEAGARAILKILSHELTAVMDRARSLLLPQTVNAKLAQLLFQWRKEDGLDKANKGRIDRVFTHEEIAQMICSSRETVTRLLANMSKRNIIQVTSDSILIRDGAALEKMALGLE